MRSNILCFTIFHEMTGILVTETHTIILKLVALLFLPFNTDIYFIITVSTVKVQIRLFLSKYMCWKILPVKLIWFNA